MSDHDHGAPHRHWCLPQCRNYCLWQTGRDSTLGRSIEVSHLTAPRALAIPSVLLVVFIKPAKLVFFARMNIFAKLHHDGRSIPKIFWDNCFNVYLCIDISYFDNYHFDCDYHICSEIRSQLLLLSSELIQNQVLLLYLVISYVIYWTVIIPMTEQV